MHFSGKHNGKNTQKKRWVRRGPAAAVVAAVLIFGMSLAAWFSDRKQTTVIDCKRPTASRLHPTMKPVELFEYLIKNNSKAGDIVLDLFGGSGTTLIACEKNNRKARLMELDPHYCDVIRRRYTKWAKENNKPITSGCLE